MWCVKSRGPLKPLDSLVSVVATSTTWRLAAEQSRALSVSLSLCPLKQRGVLEAESAESQGFMLLITELQGWGCVWGGLSVLLVPRLTSN